jgi:hypothetical protein
VKIEWKSYSQDKSTVLTRLKSSMGNWCDTDSYHVLGQHWRRNPFCYSPYFAMLSPWERTELLWGPENKQLQQVTEPMNTLLLSGWETVMRGGCGEEESLTWAHWGV